jgi:hypothetical protein
MVKNYLTIDHSTKKIKCITKMIIQIVYINFLLELGCLKICFSMLLHL